MTKRRIAVVLAILAVLTVTVSAVGTLAGTPPSAWADRLAALLLRAGGERASGFCTLIDERGSPLLRTGIVVRRGDRYLDPGNQWHRVTRVRGEVAQTVVDANPPIGEAAPGAGTVLAAGQPSAIPLGAARQVIVIYHTHSDESYIPSDGTESLIAAGGIYDVGKTMAASLKAAGFTVVHDLTAHDPHDAGAYPRSRRTVLDNLQYSPTLIYDVHRDSAPASEYLTTIQGYDTARILLVIGGGNPFYRSNLGIAYQMKASADSLYPGLVRGVFVAGGSFNQDLSPAGILLEMGTDVIAKEAAQRAATLWANVTAAYLGPPGP
jgi:stage II sporulation protein P